ncbi:MAG: YlxR family protein [Clostridia bacterium]|jgi:predicted RNA-binding protein YlxR (DUF448 family)|nr:YlxR family protein [Clostridia bacterium]
MRKCVGCNEMKNKKELIRVVKSKEGEISLDFTGKANGRGAYVCKSMECLEKAIKTKGIERAFETKISEEIYEALKKEMEENE